jgi:hypothetical protein
VLAVARLLLIVQPAMLSVRAEAQAAPAPASPVTDHFALTGLYDFAAVSTSGRIDPSATQAGTPFSAEDTLGLSSRAWQPQVELMFRFVNRNRLRVDFIDLRRSGSVQLAAPLQFGAQAYRAGQSLQSELDWRQTAFT